MPPSWTELGEIRDLASMPETRAKDRCFKMGSHYIDSLQLDLPTLTKLYDGGRSAGSRAGAECVPL